jgi:putative FmdB family regulatory protein
MCQILCDINHIRFKSADISLIYKEKYREAAMPVYEYRCEKCNNKFEIMRGITAGNEEIKCPGCGAKETKKLFSAVCGGRTGGEANRGNLRFPT